MKRLTFFFFLAVLSSCSSIPWTSSTAWDRGKTEEAPQGPAIAVGTILVDKTLGALSVQAELARLAELLILEYGYQAAPEGTPARYRLELQAVEREYVQGWQNRRSIAVDAWLYDLAEGATHHNRPLAIGRAVAVGTKSLASSRDLEGMLRKALDPVLSRELQP